MELWIRSQDRNLFEKADMIKVGIVAGSPSIIVNNDYVYGEYETKERALEVLDEIENILKPTMIIKKTEGVIATIDNTMHIINPTYGEITQLSTIVYEMPKE